MTEPEKCQHENAEPTGKVFYVSPLLYQWKCPECGLRWKQRSKKEVEGPREPDSPEKEAESQTGYIYADYVPSETLKAAPLRRRLDPVSYPVGAIFYLEYMERMKGEEPGAGPDLNNFGMTKITDNENDMLELDARTIIYLCGNGKITEDMPIEITSQKVDHYLKEHEGWSRSYSSIFQLCGPNGEPGNVREFSGWEFDGKRVLHLEPYDSWHPVVRRIAHAEGRGEIEVALQIALGVTDENWGDYCG